ncbi:MAG: hypothetical protein UZ17_ACD001002636 [Acidobacteria bacterium OLB17]|nr:MAG: hypothetical protein UZ17_ACD001002636 [Acidobacteria bacterium OLB17]MCZ2390862.1 hypothetical protein [Acidobacteriota bacterium]
MKLAVLAVISALFFTMSITAQAPETVSIKAGQRKSAVKGRLKIKFLSVEEDSRCPEGANCIWAGNAKIKIAVSGMYETKTFELNTNMAPQSVTMDCWAIEIESLLPAKDAEKATDQKDYVAKLKITRLQR